MNIRRLSLGLALLAGAVCAVAVRANGSPRSLAGPSGVMIYGGILRKPLVIVKKDNGDHYYLSCMGSMGMDPRQIGKGPHLNLAIFWQSLIGMDKGALRTLKPEQASQHGRLYLPSQ